MSLCLCPNLHDPRNGPSVTMIRLTPKLGSVRLESRTRGRYSVEMCRDSTFERVPSMGSYRQSTYLRINHVVGGGNVDSSWRVPRDLVAESLDYPYE